MDQVAGGLPWSRLRRIADHVQTNLAAELRLTELAAVVHMSPYHFARLFKQATGVSPRQFVIRRRIEAAKILLAARRQSIGEVALAVGFLLPEPLHDPLPPIDRHHAGTLPERRE